MISLIAVYLEDNIDDEKDSLRSCGITVKALKMTFGSALIIFDLLLAISFFFLISNWQHSFDINLFKPLK